MTRDDQKEKDRSRKERVLHTRVPPVLEKELRRLAVSLRVPVSNMVRAILEDAVAVADLAGRRTEAELRSWAERLSSERDRIRDRMGCAPRKDGGGESGGAPADKAPEDPFAGLLGFQPIVLATGAECCRCGRALAAGEEAFLGIREVPGPRLFVGRECVPRPQVGKETRR